MLSRLGLPVEGRRYTELLYDVFVELVTRHHLFHYRDFGFLDEGVHARVVGQTNSMLVLFAEKAGRFELVREIAQAFDATTLALGGYPSSPATEYLLQALQQRGVLDAAPPAAGPAVSLFSVVDYDPAGYWIEREFTDQIRAFGIEAVTLHTLIRPERLAPEQVRLGRYTLKKGRETANWLRATGGIDGEPHGLEADAFPPDAIRAAFVEKATPFLRALRPVEGLMRLLEEAARRRRDVLSWEEVGDRLAQMATGELLELTRHLRERLVPGQDPPAPAVAERIVQMNAEELRELIRHLRERPAWGPAPA